MLKKTGRWLLRILAVVLVAIAAGTLIPLPLWQGETAQTAQTDQPRQKILVLFNTIHTDIAVPINAQTRPLLEFLSGSDLPLDHPQAQWVVFGWGGRTFYMETPTWSDLRPYPVFKALTIDDSAMHVDIAGYIDEKKGYSASFEIEAQNFVQMMNYIRDTFKTGPGGIVNIPIASDSRIDRFFEAHGHFNALVGCNTWTAHALRTAGLKTGLWNPLPRSLLFSLWLFNPSEHRVSVAHS